MVAASQDAPRAAWWMDKHRLLVRRIDRLTFGRVGCELTEGLPPGITVRRESTKTANDMFVIYVDGVSVERISNIDGDGAAPVAQWIERYAEEINVEDVTDQGLELLKVLALKGGTIKRAYAGVHGGVINAQVKKGLVTVDSKMIGITAAGIEVLRGLPDFDAPVLAPASAEEMASPPAPLQVERGENEANVLSFEVELGDTKESIIDAAETVNAFGKSLRQTVIDAVNRASTPEEFEALALQMLDDRLVRVVMADGIGLDAVVTWCGAQIMAMGGTVIKLALKEALLRELYPPLSKLLDGLDAVGAPYAVIGDLQIIVERPTGNVSMPLNWEPN